MPRGAVHTDRTIRWLRPPDEVWEAMARTDRYRAWWPWLRRFDAAGVATGDEWRCEVQPPLPYRLRFTIHLLDVERGRHVRAEVDGDIRGPAALELTATPDGGTDLRLEATLTPASAALKAAALVPLMTRLGHDWVIETGLRQFRDRALAPP